MPSWPPFPVLWSPVWNCLGACLTPAQRLTLPWVFLLRVFLGFKRDSNGPRSYELLTNYLWFRLWLFLSLLNSRARILFWVCVMIYFSYPLRACGIIALTSQLNLGWGSFMLPQDDHKTGELPGLPDGQWFIIRLQCRNTCSVPSPGRYHMLRGNYTHVPQPWAYTLEPIYNNRSHGNEKVTYYNYRKSHVAAKTCSLPSSKKKQREGDFLLSWNKKNSFSRVIPTYNDGAISQITLPGLCPEVKYNS